MFVYSSSQMTYYMSEIVQYYKLKWKHNTLTLKWMDKVTGRRVSSVERRLAKHNRSIHVSESNSWEEINPLQAKYTCKYIKPYGYIQNNQHISYR